MMCHNVRKTLYRPAEQEAMLREMLDVQRDHEKDAIEAIESQ